MEVRDIESALRSPQPRDWLAKADRHAAVAIALRHRQEIELCLIRRAVNPRDPWSGQMGFPGGKMEPQDQDLSHTAMREAYEEIGLDLSAAHLAGRLDDFEAMAKFRRVGLIIRPFVFMVDSQSEIGTIQHSEVASVHWASLQELRSGARDAIYDLKRDGNVYKMPGFRVDEHVVWGLTHAMLKRLFERGL